MHLCGCGAWQSTKQKAMETRQKAQESVNEVVDKHTHATHLEDILDSARHQMSYVVRHAKEPIKVPTPHCHTWQLYEQQCHLFHSDVHLCADASTSPLLHPHSPTPKLTHTHILACMHQIVVGFFQVSCFCSAHAIVSHSGCPQYMKLWNVAVPCSLRLYNW